jgi:AcrR family transcriptional regulator
MPQLAAHHSATTELPRRERRKLEIRTKILEAAADLFEERGCKAATVVDICERADVAKASFFNHFPSKQDLLCELAITVFDDLVGDVDRVRSEQPDTASALQAFFATIAGQMAKAGPTAREFTVELIRATQDAGFESDESKRLNAAFERLIEDGRRRGDVSGSHKNETLGEMIGAVYYGLIMGWIQNEHYEIERKATEAVRFLADAITTRKENGNGST